MDRKIMYTYIISIKYQVTYLAMFKERMTVS